MIKASEGGGGKGIRKSTSPDDFENLFRQVKDRRIWPSFRCISFSLRCKQKFPVHRYSWWNMPTVVGIWKCKSLPIKAAKRYPYSDEIVPFSDVIRRSSKKHRLSLPHQKFSNKWRRLQYDWRKWSAMSGTSRCFQWLALWTFIFADSAGTIEYLYNPNDQSFFFLELNPRLQVEHPCTEMVTDVNLPACQLQVQSHWERNAELQTNAHWENTYDDQISNSNYWLLFGKIAFLFDCFEILTMHEVHVRQKNGDGNTHTHFLV